MKGFSIDWLALREPYDIKARNADVLNTVVAAFDDHSSISIIDLACGAGSTLCALSKRLSGRQYWRLADNDANLLARAVGRAERMNLTATAHPLDLARDLETALDESIDLVTTSAFLDLVSDEWLSRLSVELAMQNLPFYAGLTYDGCVILEPSDPLDDAVIAAFNMHQKTNKGFGPALGPAAAYTAIMRFESAGYYVVQGKSDWIFEPQDKKIQTEILVNWVSAASETRSLAEVELSGWLTRRSDMVAAGRSLIKIGHVDFFARPIKTR